MGVAPHKQKLIEAFGHSKTIREWVEDPRCLIEYEALYLRVFQYNWDPEEAITTPPHEDPKFEAFGEFKTLKQWSSDPRCVVSEASFRTRLYLEWPLEKAIVTPKRPRIQLKTQIDRTRKLPGPHGVVFEAFGELKSLKDWALDSRCSVRYVILRNRLRKGWALEDAISVGINGGNPIAMALPDPKGAGVPEVIKPHDMFKAFGTLKTLQEWSKDPRCVVLPRTIARRLKAGEPLEEALTRQEILRTVGPRESYLAFGEAKSLGDWSRDERCVVPMRVLKTRMNRGMNPEAAITTPEIPKEHREAFGESKSIAQWLADPRCKVTSSGLSRRLHSGWRFEDALTFPKYKMPDYVSAHEEKTAILEPTS